MPELSLYILGPLLFLMTVATFIFRIEWGILVFFTAGLSIQYLERLVFGPISGLDVAGAAIPILLLVGLYVRGKVVSELARDRSITVYDRSITIFLLLLPLLFFSGIIFAGLLFPNRSPLAFMEKLGVWAKFFNGFVVLLVVSSLFDNEKKINTLLSCMLLSLIVPGAIAFWEIVTGTTRIHGSATYPMPWAFFHHPAVIAFGVVVLFPVALFKYSRAKSKLKAFWCIVIILMLILIFATYRRVVWLGLATQLFIWFFIFQMGKYRIVNGYAGILVLVLIVSTHLAGTLQDRLADIYTFFANIPGVFTDERFDYLLTGRWGMYRRNIEYFFAQQPPTFFLGNGIGSTRYAGGGNHNCYLILLLEFGLICFVGYISLTMSLFVKSMRFLKSPDGFVRDYSKLFVTLLVSYLVMGFGTHMFYEITSGVWFFWGLSGAMLGILRDRTDAIPIPGASNLTAQEAG